MEVKTFETVEKLNIFAAEKFIEIANDSISKSGRFTVALSGGSTPRKLYSLLAADPYRSQIEWKKVFFFFGDERNVPIDSEESNFRMANELLFEPLKIHESCIYHFNIGLEILEENLGECEETVAEEYSSSVEYFFRGFPRFDLIFLGMGADGHTASLFPNTKALHETKRIAVENWVEKLQTWRFTLTFPTINNARNIVFLIAGADKKETLREVLEGEFQPEKLPSQAVKPIDGNLLILTDIEL